MNITGDMWEGYYRLAHLDTEQESNKKHWNGEEEKEHEEPSAPVQPVAETHHPHVLLECTRKKKADVKIRAWQIYYNLLAQLTQRFAKHTLSFLSFSCTTARTMLREV